MSKHVTTASWDEVPHLTQAQKEELYASIPPYQRDARSKGIPQLGSGAIYPIGESEFLVDPFDIPVYWPRGYGMDVGWNKTAVIWGAHDYETDTVYLYAEHYRGQAEPSVHAASIRAKGEWMHGVIDPASRGRGQKDGEQLLTSYVDLGLSISPAKNGVEAGIFDVYERLTTGRLKVFRTLQNWMFEFRLYRRDEKGQIVKQNDHLMDATRYFIVSGIGVSKIPPDYLEKFASGGRKSHKIEYDPLARSTTSGGHQVNYNPLGR